MVMALRHYDFLRTRPHVVCMFYVSVVGLVLETLCALFGVCLFAGQLILYKSKY